MRRHARLLIAMAARLIVTLALVGLLIASGPIEGFVLHVGTQNTIIGAIVGYWLSQGDHEVERLVRNVERIRNTERDRDRSDR